MDYAEDGDLRKFNDAILAGAVGLNPQDGERFVAAEVFLFYGWRRTLSSTDKNCAAGSFFV